jgi:DNA-binding NarL/FixJ family response regulator
VQAANTTNGLFVNGVRLAAGAVHLLSNSDEIRLGERTMLAFHALAGTGDRSQTQTARGIPDLTPAERRVLLCLCSPVLDGDAFTPPATVAAIAEQLYVTDSAIKQQLVRLYLKFGIEDGPDRRVRLANDALTRGAVRRADLQTFRAT